MTWASDCGSRMERSEAKQDKGPTPTAQATPAQTLGEANPVNGRREPTSTSADSTRRCVAILAASQRVVSAT